MLRSKELRARAWESLKGKYWMALVATLITGLLNSAGGFFTNLASNISGINQMVLDSNMQLDTMMEIGFYVILKMAIIVAVIGFVLAILIQGPAIIGSHSYFIKNTNSNPALSETISGFKTNYGRNVKTMFFLNLKLILWTCLFIIPGIIKEFEYAIVPYILADDPEISSKDAFKQAKEMMKGNKWRLFKLNFSFIGWTLLAVLTCGIGAFFLVPYISAANAEFYMELKNARQ